MVSESRGSWLLVTVAVGCLLAAASLLTTIVDPIANGWYCKCTAFAKSTRAWPVAASGYLLGSKFILPNQALLQCGHFRLDSLPLPFSLAMYDVAQCMCMYALQQNNGSKQSSRQIQQFPPLQAMVSHADAVQRETDQFSKFSLHNIFTMIYVSEIKTAHIRG